MIPKHQKLLAVFVLITIGITTSAASAQVDEPKVITPLGYAIAFSSFIVSGVFYSSSGYVKSIRRALVGEKVKLDYGKMGKSVGLGVLIGIGAFIWSAYSGNSFIEITTPNMYFTQIGLNTSAILLVDKWILGRPEEPKKQKSPPD